VRYTRWAADDVTPFANAHSKEDQIEMLVGVSRSSAVNVGNLRSDIEQSQLAITKCAVLDKTARATTASWF
jgi:hypothetical protein